MTSSEPFMLSLRPSGRINTATPPRVWRATHSAPGTPPLAIVSRHHPEKASVLSGRIPQHLSYYPRLKRGEASTLLHPEVPLSSPNKRPSPVKYPRVTSVSEVGYRSKKPLEQRAHHDCHYEPSASILALEEILDGELRLIDAIVHGEEELHAAEEQKRRFQGVPLGRIPVENAVAIAEGLWNGTHGNLSESERQTMPRHSNECPPPPPESDDEAQPARVDVPRTTSPAAMAARELAGLPSSPPLEILPLEKRMLTSPKRRVDQSPIVLSGNVLSPAPNHSTKTSPPTRSTTILYASTPNSTNDERELGVRLNALALEVDQLDLHCRELIGDMLEAQQQAEFSGSTKKKEEFGLLREAVEKELAYCHERRALLIQGREELMKKSSGSL